MTTTHNRSLAEQIFHHALRYSTPCCSEEGLPCALVPLTPFAHDLLPVRSVLFRDWLIDTFHREHELLPPPRHLQAAVQMLEAKARRSDFARQSLALRLSYQGEPFDPTAILVDLYNPDGEAVRITAEGYEIVSPTPVFRRSRSQQSLPVPGEPNLSLNFPFPPAALAWLVSALRPTGPYPILVLQGPAGNGKSMLARLLRNLIDPSQAAFCPQPRSEGQLMRLAWNNYVLAFDDAGDLPLNIIRALTRLSSGAAFEFDRSIHSADSLPILLQRPILLTVSGDRSPLATLLANHAIVVDLPPISAAQRRTERDILFEFECARPALLAAACTAVSLALGNVSTQRSEFHSRFADAFHWAVAAAPALGISEPHMRLALCPDTLAREVAAFAHQRQHWEGSATELLDALKTARIPDLPISPEHLTRRLRQAPLSTLGVIFDTSRTSRSRKLRMTLSAHSGVTKTQCA